MLQIGLQTGQIVELQHRGVLVVHAHQRFVWPAMHDPPSNACSADRWNLPQSDRERVREQAAVGVSQVRPRPEQHQVRDHGRRFGLTRRPRSGGPGGGTAGSVGRGGDPGSGVSLGRGSRFGPRGFGGSVGSSVPWLRSKPLRWNGLPPSRWRSHARFGGTGPPSRGRSDSRFGGTGPPSRWRSHARFGGTGPPSRGRSDSRFGGTGPPSRGRSHSRFGGTGPPSRWRSHARFGGAGPPSRWRSHARFGGTGPPSRGRFQSRFGGACPLSRGRSHSRFRAAGGPAGLLRQSGRAGFVRFRSDEGRSSRRGGPAG